MKLTLSGNSVKTILATAAMVLIGVLLYFLPIKEILFRFLLWVQKLGIWGPFLIACFYIIAPVFLIPGSILTLGAGFLFGLAVGFAAVWSGAFLGACAAFLVGRTFLRNWVQAKATGRPKFAAIDEAIGREGFKIVLLLRLSPLFPYNFLNYVLGLTKVSFRQYAVATFLGMVPVTLMYVYFGSAARSLAEVASGESQVGGLKQIVFWLGLVLTIIVTVFITRLAKRSLNELSGPSRQEVVPEADSKNLTHSATIGNSTKSKEAAARPGNAELGWNTMNQKQLETKLIPTIEPNDRHNYNLMKNTRPATWRNPKPAPMYNLVVIGAGTAGLISAAGAAGLGAKTALVEKAYMGGDCLNFGCVPSKTLIAASRVAANIKSAGKYGIHSDNPVVNFPKVMERVRKTRAVLSVHDSVDRFTGMGVDVFLGQAEFESANSVNVQGQTLYFRKAIIAAGARAAPPRIPGIVEAGFFTNETIFSITELPKRLAIIGAGPIGCEMAQTFQRLGSQVYLIHRHEKILEKEDSEASEILQTRMLEEKVNLLLNSQTKLVEITDKGKVIHLSTQSGYKALCVDQILVAVGRSPNIEGLHLEIAGIEYDRSAIKVDDYLQTSNKSVFAAGDVCMARKFTHAADAAARMAIENALFFKSKKLSSLIIPWCTYTAPEIAQVGIVERDLDRASMDEQVFRVNLDQVDRAVTDGVTDGFIKVITEKGSDRILGATIVAENAGDLISQIAVAMKAGIGLKTVSGCIFPYPTQAELIKKAADAYNRSRLTPFIQKIFEKWLAWRL